MASTLACALCADVAPQPDAMLGYRHAASGPGWPILAHLVCAAAEGARVIGTWTLADTAQLERAWTGGVP
ncbi:hypothetical protein [Streptomyces sp. C10-9-1]|uniref:hypothetical protein n=1 Tax=Streptomyces sp. C10-9-1 TaxID=1859285 RepID=UPI003D726C43